MTTIKLPTAIGHQADWMIPPPPSGPPPPHPTAGSLRRGSVVAPPLDCSSSSPVAAASPTPRGAPRPACKKSSRSTESRPEVRNLAGSLRWLSLNTATVREQWDLRQAADGCVRHGIPGIAPWRDQVQALGPKQAGDLIRDHGLVSGLCRAGLFTAPDAAGRQAAIDDNFRAIDEAAAIGAQCL